MWLFAIEFCGFCYWVLWLFIIELCGILLLNYVTSYCWIMCILYWILWLLIIEFCGFLLLNYVAFCYCILLLNYMTSNYWILLPFAIRRLHFGTFSRTLQFFMPQHFCNIPDVFWTFSMTGIFFIIGFGIVVTSLRIQQKWNL